MKEDLVLKAKEGKWRSHPKAKGVVDGIKFEVHISNSYVGLYRYSVTAKRDPNGDKMHCETEYFSLYHNAKKLYDELVRKYNLTELSQDRHW